MWSGAGDIVSLSLSGDLSVFDRKTAAGPARVIRVRAPRERVRALTPRRARRRR